MSARRERVAAALIARVGANVARLRAARGLTVAEVSKRSGLHRRHLQKIEAGELNATMSTISKLARTFEVTPETLLARAGTPKRPRRG
jgi:transcriptional regulator with XRE-family HTH domain